MLRMLREDGRQGSVARVLGVALRSSALALLIGFSAAPSAHALAGSCQELLDAVGKQISTPSHSYMTMTMGGGKAKLSETIQAGGAIFVMIDGKWSRSPMTAQALQNLHEENLKRTKAATCSQLRNELVNGEAATVYSMQNDVNDGNPAKTDSLIWVSKSRGLPLRSEIDIASGTTKTHVSARYEYGNIAPPAGVR